MKKKIAIVCSLSALVILVFVLVGMISTDSGQAKNEAAVKEAAEAFIRSYDEKSADKLKYNGIVSATEDIHVGEAEFECGDYRFYYDLDSQKMTMFYNFAPAAQGAGGLSREKAETQAYKLLQLVQGDYISKGCKAELSENDSDLTVVYNYEKEGTTFPAAMVSFTYDGILRAATFADVGKALAEYIGNEEISEEKAFDIAEKEAQKYMKKRSPEKSGDYILAADSIECSKKYRNDLHKIVWEIEMRYDYKGVNPYDEKNPPEQPAFAFLISVDVKTGKILENANNWN